MMVPYATKDGKLTVYEAVNGYYITNNQTGETRGMSDLVDWELWSHDQDPYRLLEPGTPEFNAALAELIESESGYYMEAYFGEED